MPKVSVIIPAYNAERFIKNSVGLIKNQTFKDFECIYIDDGSLDDTFNLLTQLTEGDNRFKIVKNANNLGQASSRNLGLKMARGKYILWLDVDDLYAPNLLSKTYEEAERTNAEITVFNLNIISARSNMRLNSAIDSRNIPDRIFTLKELNNGIGPGRFSILRNELWNKLFNRHFLLSNNLNLVESIRNGEDLDLSIRSLLKASRIAFIDMSLITYNALQGTGTKGVSSKSPLDIYRSLENIFEFMTKEKLVYEFHDDFYFLMFNSITYCLNSRDNQDQAKLVHYFPTFIHKLSTV